MTDRDARQERLRAALDAWRDAVPDLVERADADPAFARRLDRTVELLSRATRDGGTAARPGATARAQAASPPGPDSDRPETGADDEPPHPADWLAGADQPAAARHSFLEGLNAAQLEAATITSGPVAILAGAGTGKTRVIAHRVAHAVAAGAVRPEHVLVVTFTEKAAREMAERLRGLGLSGVAARTFHAAALRQLRHFWARISDDPFPEVLESKAGLVHAALTRERVPYTFMPPKDFADVIEWAKVRRVPPERLESAAASADRALPAPIDVVRRVWTAYERSKERAGRIDFEDILVRTVELLETRTDVGEEIRDRYRWFSVDEYQDTNEIQEALLRLWLGDRRDVCVVGDPDQTIYSFTGASADFLTSFPRRYPGCRVVELRENYRSTPQVIALANRLASPSRSGQTRLVATHTSGPEPRIVRFLDEHREVDGVVARVDELISAGVPPGEIAILVRVNAQIAPFEEAFTRAGIAHQVRGEPFFARRDVRDAVAALRRLPARDRAAARADLRADVAGTLGAQLGYVPGADARTDAARERQASLDLLVELADELGSASGETTIDGYLAEIERRRDAERDGAVDGVTLSTIHRAKGLEWDAVLLPSWEEGLMPHAAAKHAVEVAEERRLAYVAITRAREHLWIGWAGRRRGPRGGDNARTRSRFLDEIAHAAPAPRSVPASGAVAARGRAEPRPAATPALFGDETEDGAGGPDPSLVAALKAWRLEQARSAAIPPYVIMWDATLAAIAEARPRSVSELLGIKGVGPAKAEKYGADIVAICSRHRGEP